MRKNIISFLSRNNWIKSVPNTLTVGNSICGFAAILVTLQAYKFGSNPETIFEISSCLIICAMVFDALDGFAARILNAASLKGIQMDSLADMVTFGVAPAVLVAVMAHIYSATTIGYWIAWALSGLYLACAAHRLAQYNVTTMVEKKSGKKFCGLPSPGGAAAICSVVFLFCEYDRGHFLVKILPFYAGFLGLLMVSNVRYRHVGKWLVNIKRNRSRWLLIVVIFICLILKTDITAAVVITAYVFWGLIADMIKRFSIQKHRNSKVS